MCIWVWVLVWIDSKSITYFEKANLKSNKFFFGHWFVNFYKLEKNIKIRKKTDTQTIHKSKRTKKMYFKLVFSKFAIDLLTNRT